MYHQIGTAGMYVLSSSAYDVRMYQLEYNPILLYHPDQLGGGLVDDKNQNPPTEAVGRMTVTAWPGRRLVTLNRPRRRH